MQCLSADLAIQNSKYEWVYPENATITNRSAHTTLEDHWTRMDNAEQFSRSKTDKSWRETAAEAPQKGQQYDWTVYALMQLRL